MGPRIKTLRKTAGLTLEEVGNSIGKTKQTIVRDMSDIGRAYAPADNAAELEEKRADLINRIDGIIAELEEIKSKI